MKRLAFSFVGFAIAIAIGSCSAPDPIHENAVSALGKEKGAANEFHRAGQPCTTCHSAKTGPAKTDFSVGGTVFASPDALVGAANVTIELTDSAGTSPNPITTNCVGNFYVLRSAWDPVFPIVSVKLTQGATTKQMNAVVGGNGSCASCHLATTAPSNPLVKIGAVYIFDDAASAPPAATDCPVSPEVTP